MNLSLVLRFLLCLLLWGMWVYQVKTGKLLGGNWRVWTTEKERPKLFFAVVAIQGLGFLVGSIWLICDALLN